MENLPLEILSYIMKYLNRADRREFALACKKFYDASLDPDLYWDSKYVFDAHALIPDDDTIRDSQFYCKSPNLFISGLSENINVKPLVNPQKGCVSVLGPHVQKLSLKGSAILEGSFVEILKKCEELEGLDITGCKDLFLTGSFLKSEEKYSVVSKVLEGLKDLNLSSIRYLNNSCLKTFINLCPELVSLSLASCNILFSEFGSTQSQALTFPCLLQVFGMRSSTLVRIDLSRTGLTNSALKDVATVKGLQLKEIVLQNCREVGDGGIISLAKNQPRLQVIDIRGCCEVGNPALSAICTCAPNLRKLFIAKCRKVSDEATSKILLLDRLEVLDISECFNVSKSIPAILASLPRLTSFTANGCSFSKFDEQILQQKGSGFSGEKLPTMTKYPSTFSTPNFANLTKLSVSSGKYVTDLTIQSIFMHFTNLEELSLSWCHYITDRGLVGLDINISDDRMFPAVEKADADFLSTGRYSTTHGRSGFLGSPGSEYISHVDWDKVDYRLCLKDRGIGRLRHLRQLALSNCRNVTDESLIRIFCVGSPLFPEMEQLEFNMMQRSITDDVLNGISIGCPLLTKLSISCSNVTDSGIDCICHRLHRLESLNLSNCDLITPGAFGSLVRNNRWLRELDISSCKQVPASSAERLRKALPLLARVHTRYSGV